MARPGDGWREPRLALLRSISVAVGLCLVVYVVVFAPLFSLDGRVDLGTLGYLVGFVLAMLVFEGAIRWPPVGRG